MTTENFVKDPDAVLDYVWDWTAWLTDGETIDTVTWLVEAGITQDFVTKTDSTATIWLSGGTLGEWYDITCRILTTQGRIDDRTRKIQVKAR